MSVFTALSANDIRRFLSAFDVGGLIDWQGVPGGSENTNYFLNCDSGWYVLTLIERGPPDGLPFFVELLEHLHQCRLPVPYAIVSRDGEALHTLKGKPALLQPRFHGEHRMSPDVADCRAVGTMLARLHEAAQDTGLKRDSDRGPEWVLHHSRLLLEDTWREERKWLEPELEQLQQWLSVYPATPRTIIHGDLFRDNVLFDGTRISGVIDFYNAASGPMSLDLAICHNDWCFNEGSENSEVVDGERATALMDAYRLERPLTDREERDWPQLLKLAALRFWTSRELARKSHADQAGVLVKDPSRFRRILRHHCGLPS